MNWRVILKAPVFTQNEVDEYTGEDPDDRFDKYLADLNRFGNKLPMAFQSKDGNARAKFRFTQDRQGKPFWDLNIFEIIKDERGQGKGRVYLKEFVEDIRDVEKQLNEFNNQGHLEIIATQTFGESTGFWEKMIKEGIIQGHDLF